LVAPLNYAVDTNLKINPISPLQPILILKYFPNKTSHSQVLFISLGTLGDVGNEWKMENKKLNDFKEGSAQNNIFSYNIFRKAYI
jgi:hypothetical protein